MALKLIDQGSLTRPGPIGRLLRLSLGLLCAYSLWELARIAPDFIAAPVQFLPNLLPMLLAAVYIFNYVINIGFSQDWQRYPLIISLGWFALLAVAGYAINGDVNSQLLGLSLLIWLMYFFAHLGASFLLAALLAIPGCVMRAIPNLIGRFTGTQSSEHHCPVSLIAGIDNWEKKRRET